MKIKKLVQEIEKTQLEKTQTKRNAATLELPIIKVGDTVRINVLIQENTRGDEKGLSKDRKDAKKTIKERIQAYEGTVIAQQKQGGLAASITVRRVFQGIGIERIFTLYSPCVQAIKIIKRAQVRRAKLYYLRDRVGKATRLKQKL
jgi:large subunit ribosomal protein L19